VNPFEAIQYVGTPIALVAFVAAVVAWVFRARLAERRKLIESAPEAERGRLLEATIRDFTTVPTDTLTREQRYNLAVKLIDERAAKFKMMTNASIVVALIFAAIIALFTYFPSGEAEASSLTVRVHGPGGVADFITSGEVTLDAGADRDTRPIGPDGQVRFENVPKRAFGKGVILTPRVTGYRAAVPTTLTAFPAGAVFDLPLEPVPTRVYGIVVDAKRNPVAGVILTFKAGLAADTTDQAGNFDVVLPYPAGSRVPVRALKNGITGFNDMITIPDDAALTLYFDAHS
jgi:hypothetical protein